MNERIRELWAQCVVKHTKDPMNWQTVADEFAELIVRECAEVAGCNGHVSGFALGDLMKEHFGVDE